MRSDDEPTLFGDLGNTFHTSQASRPSRLDNAAPEEQRAETVRDACATDTPSRELTPARKVTGRNSRARSSGNDAPSRTSGGTKTGPSLSGESYLTVQEVADLFNCTVQTIWLWAREKNGFPRPVKVAAGMTRWRGSEILAFEKQIWEAAKRAPLPDPAETSRTRARRAPTGSIRLRRF